MNALYENIENIIIDEKQVYKFLGYGNSKPSLVIQNKVIEEIEVFKQHADIKVYHKVVDIVNIDSNIVYFENDLKLQSKHLAEGLSNCIKAYIVFTTLGHRINNRINYYGKQFDTIKSLVLDKVSIVGMDDVNKKFKDWVNAKEKPYRISTEIFTGEKDFGVENVALLLRVFDNIDIKINKYNIINPIKTVVYILGIGKENNLMDKCLKCENPCK